jgi:hypothetical protein
VSGETRARFALVLGSVALVLVLGEVVLRAREVPETLLAEHRAKLRAMDDVVHHALRPNTRARVRWGNDVVPYATNSLGFRDHSVRTITPRPAGGPRVLILGDSFAEGIGIAYERSFTAQLEGQYAARGIDAEVLTGGTVSYSPRFEYRQLSKFLEAGHETNAIIQLLDVSDVHDEGERYFGWNGHTAADRDVAARKNARELEELRLEESSWRYVLTSRLWSRLVRSANPNPLPPRYARAPRFQWTEDPEVRAEPWVDRGIAISQNYLARSHELARKRGIHYWLVLYPHPSQLSGSKCMESEYRSRFSAFALERDIQVVDLFPAFCSLKNWQTYFIERDIHWNARGHALVANALRNATSKALR